jgi:hypothetical protein
MCMNEGQKNNVMKSRLNISKKLFSLNIHGNFVFVYISGK